MVFFRSRMVFASTISTPNVSPGSVFGARGKQRWLTWHARAGHAHVTSTRCAKTPVWWLLPPRPRPPPPPPLPRPRPRPLLPPPLPPWPPPPPPLPWPPPPPCCLHMGHAGLRPLKFPLSNCRVHLTQIDKGMTCCAAASSWLAAQPPVPGLTCAKAETPGWLAQVTTHQPRWAEPSKGPTAGRSQGGKRLLEGAGAGCECFM